MMIFARFKFPLRLTRNTVLVGGGLLLLAGCSGQTSNYLPASHGNYGSVQQPIKICSGYGCVLSDKFSISQDEKTKIAALMNQGRSANAAEEREAIQKAVAYFEKIARANLRYAPDVEYSYQRHARKRGQMDCIDESLNTIAFLRYLQSQNLMAFHKPIKTFAERGLLVDGRYPHKSARIRENNGQDWAVDSWKGPNGAVPEIMPLKVWYRDRNSPSHYQS